MELKNELEMLISQTLGCAVSLENDDNLMYDYGMDSIEIMSLIIAIEEKFDIEFELEDLDIENLMILSKLGDAVARIFNRENA